MIKKIISIFVVLSCAISLLSCEKPPVDTKPIINMELVNEVIAQIDELPNAKWLYLTDEKAIYDVYDKYETLNEEEKKLITNIQDLLDCKEKIDFMLAEVKANEEFSDSLPELLEQYIPDEITEDITLPENVGEIELSWSSSKEDVFDGIGNMYHPRNDTVIELKATAFKDKMVGYYTKEVTVKGAELRDLSDKKPVFSYVTNMYSMSFEHEEYNKIDVFNYGIAKIDEEGNVEETNMLKKTSLFKCREYGVRTVFCVGGYQAGAINFSKLCKTSEGRTKLVTSLVNYMVDNGYDGIDIDWEYPGYYGPTYSIDLETDSNNYSLFIEELYNKVKMIDRDYIVSAALPGGPYGSKRYDIGEVSKYLDYIHLMTYDMNSSNVADYHVALYANPGVTGGGSTVKESIDYYLSKGAKKSQLIVGAAMYGRKSTVFASAEHPTGLGAEAQGNSTIDYSKIVSEYLSKPEIYTEYFDEVSKVPYLYGKNTFITYDNVKSLEYKVEYIYDNDLGGIMFWELGHDETGELITATHQYMTSKN